MAPFSALKNYKPHVSIHEKWGPVVISAHWHPRLRVKEMQLDFLGRMPDNGCNVKGFTTAAEGTETCLVNPGSEPNRKLAFSYQSAA